MPFTHRFQNQERKKRSKEDLKNIWIKKNKKIKDKKLENFLQQKDNLLYNPKNITQVYKYRNKLLEMLTIRIKDNSIQTE